MIKRIAFTASLLTALAAAAQAQVPFLSFADNSTSAITRTSSTFNSTTSTFDSTIDGMGSGYTSLSTSLGITGPLSYSFTAPVLVSSSTGGLQDFGTTGAGTISVFNGATRLFDVEFEGGQVSNRFFSVSETDAQPGVVVYTNIDSSIASLLADTDGDAFSFSFSNPTVTGGSVTYSTSGTFATQPVPEPATMAALGLGAVAMLRRRRKA